MDWLLLIVLPLCLATSFLCAGMEAGIFTLGRWRIAQQMRAGQARAARLYAYLQNTENFLWTILVGNTLALFFAMWIIAVALVRALPDRPGLFWLSYIAVAFGFYAFCDLLPKTLFRRFPNRLCLSMSAPFGVLHIALFPIVSLVESIANLLLRWTGGRTFKGHVFSSRHELRLLLEDTSEALTSEERGMIARVFDLHNIAVRQIAIPFARVPPLGANDLLGDALARFRETPANILPVWNADPRNRRIAGFLEAKRVIYEPNLQLSEEINRHLTPAMYVDEDIRVHDALRRMQRTGQRMAVVLSRERREIGLITVEEILKVIFGEVRLS
ncbi:MAG TPA: CNNM domain-containing protein [Verrucomicrobiae bacterium]